MTPRPADEARRALRAARAARAAGDDQGPASRPTVPEAQPDRPAPEQTPSGAPRPGDVAREALRRAVAARRAGHAEPGGTAESEQSGESSVPDGESGAEAPARGRARPTAVVEAAGGETSVRPATPAAPLRRRPQDHAAGTAARAVRELLAGAFRMPTDPDEPGSAETGERWSPAGSSDSDVPPPAETRDTASRQRGSSAPRSQGGSAPESRGSASGLSQGGSAPESRGSASGLSQGGSAPESRGSASGLSQGGSAPESRGSASGLSQGGSAPESRGSASDSPQGSSAPELRGSASRPPRRSTARPQQGSTARSAPASAAPQVPHTMAAPGRDHDLRRTFPAFPPRPADGDRFAETWWGNAWVTALEEGALDPNRLARGRGYAQQGNVDAITVTPGLVLAYVRGSRPRPYRVQVRLRTLEDADWERFLDAAADRPGHIAALLDKELPQSLADRPVPLLPGPGDLDPRCTCPDSGHPCKHAAALCYQTARLLDADPFVLLLLRGRGERELLDALSRRSATRAARAAQDKDPAPLPGIRATEALTPRTLPPLPAPLPPPPHPEQPPAYPAAPGGPDPFALDQLATDAAARAHALLTTGRDPVGGLTLWQDAVRIAAARPGSGLTAGTRALYAALASAAGRTAADLARAVAAWRQGGLEGLAVLEEPWDPPAGRFDRARPLLLAADLPAFRPWRNRLTHPRGHLQLRLGRDGLWYAYESEPGHDDWWPRGTPDLDPVGALTGLGLPGDLGLPDGPGPPGDV
ncbi:SWIM zinc finger family protein [Streptomyces sp. NPDC052682]|uniref:SWIM zinc finger family protein n=1 Tax=Streptomyces sp. NPDC052682 TaxID=3154954 RepID=UPI003428154D